VSLFPDAARAAGIGYDELVDRLVKLALARAVGVGA
jgi:D-alanine-D-alanine ligase-like ATP-grasp enzyme